MRRALIGLALFSGSLVALAVLLFSPILEHTRHASSDGHFIVVARTQPIYLFIPMMPGSSSDKPAAATLFKDGASCGSLALPMASFVYDLAWEMDTRPRRADIKFAGSWNLDTCQVETR